jgi:hypothetical protein
LLANACPKPLPRVLARRHRRALQDDALAQAYADVDRRDQGRCKATGRHTQPFAVDPRVRREHHHLEPRSVNPARITDASNIITVTAEAHFLITAKVLLVEGTNANQAIRFHWDRTKLPDGKAPFQLLSRRRSQRRECE